MNIAPERIILLHFSSHNMFMSVYSGAMLWAWRANEAANGEFKLVCRKS